MTSRGHASTAAGPAPRVSVRVLGTPIIAVDDHDVAAPELRARQARVLLTLLVLAGGDGAQRDALGGAIWIADRPRAWETALSALVSRLRSMFARVGVAGDILTFDAGVYRFVPPPEVAVDFAEVLDATMQAREAFGHGDASTAQALAEGAAQGFRGPLLPGEDSELVVRRAAPRDRRAERGARDTRGRRWRSTGGKRRSKPHALVAIQPLEEANHRRLVPRWPAPATERGHCRRTTRVGKYSTANSASGRPPQPSSCTSILRCDTERRRARETPAPRIGGRVQSPRRLPVLLVVALAATMSRS